MTDALKPLIFVLAFLAVVILTQTVASAFFRTNDQRRRVNRRLTMLDSGVPSEQVYSTLIRQNEAPAIARGQFLVFYENAALFCRQAGLSTSPMRILLYTGISILGLWLFAMAITRPENGDQLIGTAIETLLGSTLLCSLGAYFWIDRLRKKRLGLIEELLPLALDIVTRAIRAGHPVISALNLASEEMGDPIGSELGLIVDETTYGADFQEALNNFAKRTGSPDARFFAVCVSIQAQTGGNLAEILEGLTTVMRGRGTLAKRVVALASEGKTSAYLLSALPVALVAFQATFNPHYYSDKFSDPLFWIITYTVLALYVIGWIVIQRIINIKY